MFIDRFCEVLYNFYVPSEYCLCIVKNPMKRKKKILHNDKKLFKKSSEFEHVEH
jgi:hypothetical protein